MVEEGFSINVKIDDGITGPLRKLALKLPLFRSSLQSLYAKQAKDVVIQILNREFGAGNRLSAGTTVRQRRDSAVIEIKATGKKGTRGAERLAVILNEGHQPHPIFPRRPGGVLAMDKGPEGIVFRKFVRAHSIRGRKFMDTIQESLLKIFQNRAAIDVKRIKELRK